MATTAVYTVIPSGARPSASPLNYTGTVHGRQASRTVSQTRLGRVMMDCAARDGPWPPAHTAVAAIVKGLGGGEEEKRENHDDNTVIIYFRETFVDITSSGVSKILPTGAILSKLNAYVQLFQNTP